MEPARDGFVPVHGARLACKYEESGLKDVFGVLHSRQILPTDTPDERAVPAHQEREGFLIASADEALEQFAVGWLTVAADTYGSVDEMDQGSRRGEGHLAISLRSDELLRYHACDAVELFIFFARNVTTHERISD
jgi:hypothetical protein